MRISVPNALSLLRVPLSIAILATYSSRESARFLAALVLIALAVCTDVLDGFLARRSGKTSELGYILDGLGDRATYVSLILVLVASGSTSLFVAWILIFREILIYALRVLTPSWYRLKHELRLFSKLHAAGIRLWISSYMVADGLKLYTGMKVGDEGWYQVIQGTLLFATIGVAYSGIFQQGRAITIGLSGFPKISVNPKSTESTPNRFDRL